MQSQVSANLLNEGIVLRRMQRFDEEAWQNARSWLGGRPSIDPHQWPRSEYDGAPLHHLAQLDFSDLPMGPWRNMLPQTGALSFFVETGFEEDKLTSAVVYTPEPANEVLVDPPKDCPPFGRQDWTYEDLNRSAPNEGEARRVLMHWPVEFVGVQFQALDGSDNIVLTPTLDEIFGPPIPDIHIFKKPKYEHRDGGFGPVDDGIFPWDVARRIVRQCRQQKVGSLFVAKWMWRLIGKDIYEPMGTKLAQELEQDAHQVAKNAGYRLRYGSGTSIVRSAASEAFREMMVGSRGTYERIPFEIRQYLETHRRRTGSTHDGRHQVFGMGWKIQGQPENRTQEVLLFQADSDDMLMWNWGDVGAVQFWIKTDDLLAQNWDAVEATFEGG